MSYLGKELIKLRKEKGVSQENIAKKLDCTRSYICKLESGERIPNKELVLKISDVFSLESYMTNKLLILAKLSPELSSDSDSHRIALRLIIDFKNDGLLEEARYLISTCLKIFDNKIELSSLMANLHLLKDDFDKAIKLNEEVLEHFPEQETDKLKITKAEIVHNLGYVYLEKALKLKKEWEISNINKVGESEKQLRKDCIENLDTAIEKFELALQEEPEHEHIIEQLAVAYLNRASIEENESIKSNWLNKSIQMYDQVISSPVKHQSDTSKVNSSIFLAMIFGKLKKLEEASRLINIIICCQPKYFLGYYAKACIYALNGKDMDSLLKIAFSALKKAIELNSAIEKEMLWDPDLKNLSSSSVYKDWFSSFYQNELKSKEENQK